MNPSKLRGFRTGGFVQELTWIAGKGDTTTVTQTTNRSTGVTINSTIGQITTTNDGLNPGNEVTFTVTNSYCTAKSVPIVAIASGVGADIIFQGVTAVTNGSFNISYTNSGGSTFSGTLVINFILIRGE